MKGIILAGGMGSRLYPLTSVFSKQLQPVYDKPMVYYPLTTLIECGIREFCLISSEQDLPHFQRLFGDGRRLGISIEYRRQSAPRGIAEAFVIAEDFLDGDSVALILGDNLFHGVEALRESVEAFETGGAILAFVVRNPSRYGVVAFDDAGAVVSIEEKPSRPKSHFAVPGVYLYDGAVSEVAKSLKPSDRGELEITDVNLAYLARGQLKATLVNRGAVWLDAGTSSSLHEASAYVQTVEKRTGVKIGCPEEAAYRMGYLSAPEFQAAVEALPRCEYRDYLETLINPPAR